MVSTLFFSSTCPDRTWSHLICKTHAELCYLLPFNCNSNKIVCFYCRQHTFPVYFAIALDKVFLYFLHWNLWLVLASSHVSLISPLTFFISIDLVMTWVPEQNCFNFSLYQTIFFERKCECMQPLLSIYFRTVSVIAQLICYRRYWVRLLTFFFLLMLISWMVTLSSCLIILPLNRLRLYFENFGNVAECVRKLCTDFGRRDTPSAIYVRYLVEKVTETGILIDKSTRVKAVRTPENIAALAESVREAPSTYIIETNFA